MSIIMCLTRSSGSVKLELGEDVDRIMGSKRVIMAESRVEMNKRGIIVENTSEKSVVWSGWKCGKMLASIVKTCETASGYSIVVSIK